MMKRLANSCWNCWILKILQWFSLYMNENYANYANIHERNRESVICWSYRWETQGANVDLIDEAKPSLSIIYIHTESFPYVTPTYGRLFFFLKMNFLAFICKNLISWRHQELEKKSSITHTTHLARQVRKKGGYTGWPQVLKKSLIF